MSKKRGCGCGVRKYNHERHEIHEKIVLKRIFVWFVFFVVKISFILLHFVT